MASVHALPPFGALLLCGEINSMEILEENFDGSGAQAVLQAMDAASGSTMPPAALVTRDNVIVAFPGAGRDADMPK